MKVMLAEKLVDWAKETSLMIYKTPIDDQTNDIRFGPFYRDGTAQSWLVEEDFQFDGDVAFEGPTTINNLEINESLCGAIFTKTSDVTMSTAGIKVWSLGTLARGYFVNTSGATIAASTNIFTTSNTALHDAILGDVGNLPFTHILCKVKGGSIFWLSMTANGSNNVLLSPNIDLPAGADCYVIAAVQSSNVDA